MTKNGRTAPVKERETKLSSRPVAELGRLLEVALPPMDTTTVLLVGTAPLLVHAWSQKAIGAMLAKQTKTGRPAREAKDPKRDFEESRYKSKLGWDGIPAGGLRACFIDSARFLDDLTMRSLQGAIFIEADDPNAEMPLVRIYGSAPVMDQKPVRIGSGMSTTTDLRYRARYDRWALLLRVKYMRTMISHNQLATLIATAGISNGLCEHRPGSPRSKTGQLGTFRIGDESDAAAFGIAI